MQAILAVQSTVLHNYFWARDWWEGIVYVYAVCSNLLERLNIMFRRYYT
jgi:hypothetical protein